MNKVSPGKVLRNTLSRKEVLPLDIF